MKTFNAGQQISRPGRKLFDIVSPTLWYVGEALPGTGTNAASWRIKRVIFDASGNPASITWANDGEATATWDNRADESYS